MSQSPSFIDAQTGLNHRRDPLGETPRLSDPELYLITQVFARLTLVPKGIVECCVLLRGRDELAWHAPYPCLTIPLFQQAREQPSSVRMDRKLLQLQDEPRCLTMSLRGRVRSRVLEDGGVRMSALHIHSPQLDNVKETEWEETRKIYPKLSLPWHDGCMLPSTASDLYLCLI